MRRTSRMPTGVPLIAERFFSTGSQYWVVGYHYTATAGPMRLVQATAV